MRTLSPVAALALLAACGGSSDRGLQTFSDCDEMSSYMQRMAYRELRGGVELGLGRAETSFVASADMDVGGNAAEEPSFSGTNLQEQGVDEADLVKTDGEFLYTVGGGQLIVTKAWPIAEAAVLGQVAVDGHPQGLYLLDDGNTVVVITDLWYGQDPEPLSGADADLTTDWRAWSPTAAVTLVDVTDRANPVVVRETYTTGELKATRRIGDKLFLVSYEDVSVSADTRTQREERVAIQRALAQEWQTKRLDNVLTARGTEGAPDTWDIDLSPGCDCDQTYASPELGGTFVTNALVLDLADPLGGFEGFAVAGRADTVYVSGRSLYVVYTEDNDGPFASLDAIQETVVHKFDISGEVPTYAATGVIRGTLEDQFALSEKDDILRIALTDWGGSSFDVDEVTNGMYTLEQVGDTLEPLDWEIGLAPGESITAARFVGDLGYFATAEVFTLFNDPLFTFDLSDPADIKVGGALEVTGWSDYMHPIDEGHLLAVGMENEDAFGLAVSLYDVTDIENPTLAEREVLEAFGSESQTDHHAFNYFAPTQTLTIPSWANEGDTVLEVLHADAAGIEPIGQVHQDDAVLGSDPWCGGIRRSVVIDDTVWAVSAAGMTAATLAAPDTAIRGLAFDVDPCFEGYDYGDGGGGEIDVPSDEG